MIPNQHSLPELNSLFAYYPVDFIEAALSPLIPNPAIEIDEHTDIQQLFYAELNSIIQDHLAAYQKTSVNEVATEPENQALTNAQAIIRILTPIIPIAYVFFQQGIPNNGSLTIVLAQHEYKPIDDVHAAVHFSLMAYPKITFEVHTYGTMVNLIKTGHLYYASVCVQKNCIYQSQANYSLPSCNPIAFTANRLNALSLFKQHSDRAISFMGGAQQYLAKHEYTMAVFMLQQACEFTYRSLIIAFKNKNIKSHELVVLRKHLIHYAPQIIGLFHHKPKKELCLLTFLQEAYTKARYENEYQIDREQTLALLAATTNLMRGVQTLFEVFIA